MVDTRRSRCLAGACGRMLAALALLPPFAAMAQQPFSFDAAPGRLPKDVVPIDYRLEIVPNLATMTLGATEAVTLQVRSETVTVQLNSLNETLRDVRFDGRAVQRVDTDDARQLTTITLASPAAIGAHTLSFAYSGKLETLARGLFVQPFVRADGREDIVLSTKFESTDARRMFPCWDEPSFRASFELSFTVPAAWTAISNMPVARRRRHGALATTTFERSPKMPSYLLEFTAGDFGLISDDAQNVRLGVWAVNGRQRDGADALTNTRQILGDYNDYFDYRYPLPKLDSIAIPGGFAGAMENWGAITYNDQILLVPSDSTTATRQAVFSAQAHEIAHQWNGDLVTMGWWDDIWLNESFASWMAARETARRHPDWHWLENRDANKEDAMAADALPASHAIQQHVSDELQATAVFDPQITYRKGEAILRMFEAYIGPDAFRSGVRRYIRGHAFSNATTGDLWDALSRASGTDVRTILSGWTQQAGFPLISVTAECDAGGARSLHFSQQRFLLTGAGSGTPRWQVPLQIRSGTAGAPMPLLLLDDRQTVAGGRCDEPLSVNADGVGFYRVHYDPRTLALDTERFATLPDADRIALLDDQWALVESGREALDTYLSLAASMSHDLDARAWEQITAALGVVEFDERGTPGHDGFAAYARSLLRPVFERLGWDSGPGEDPDRQRVRRAVIGELGAWGDAEVIAEARRRFAAFMRDRKAIAADDQAVVLSVVAQHADVLAFDQLHALARSAQDESQLRRYYSALMYVQDADLAVQALQIALSEEIPPQAGSVRMALIVRLGQDHPALAWDAFTHHASTLLSPFARYAPLISAQQVPAWFWNGVALTDIERWVRAQVPAELAPNIERGLQTAGFRLAEKQRLLSAADEFVRGLGVP